MTNEVTRESLKAAIKQAEDALQAAKNAYDEFDQLAENNVYASLKDAERLEDVLSDRAFEDCEGAGNFGAPEYTQEFMVDGVKYVATLQVEYNRHDKTYYYIDGTEFDIKPASEA